MSDAALIRALAESHATNDKLAAELGKVRTELELYRDWITLDPDDEAIIVVADCDQQPGAWTAVFRHRESAARFCELAQIDADRDDAEFSRNLSVLEGTVSAAELKLWNSTEPAPAHPMAPTSEQLHNDMSRQLAADIDDELRKAVGRAAGVDWEGLSDSQLIEALDDLSPYSELDDDA